MLKALLECGELDDHDTEAFASMQHRLGQNREKALTKPQRDWVEDVYRRKELDQDDHTPLTDDQREQARRLGPMDFSGMGPKALAPPGRRKSLA